MKFKDYVYKRPVVETKDALTRLLSRFNLSQTAKEQYDVLMEITDMLCEVYSMMALARIRHQLNTFDEYYKKENDYINQYSPCFDEMVVMLYKVLLSSKFRDELEIMCGKQVFNLAEMTLKTFNEDVIGLIVKENQLVSEYNNLVASAKIKYKNNEYNLSEMAPFIQSIDQQERKNAHQAVDGFYEKHETAFDEIFDQLVSVRHQIATGLGFENFVELGYLRLNRSDYDANDASEFRNQVHEHIVPAVAELKDKQRRRLSLETLKYYDESLKFNTGNPVLLCDHKKMLELTRQMFSELSDESDEFFCHMLNQDLLHLQTKKGKVSGAYCTVIPTYRTPFMFGNFNGTYSDISTLAHECGHGLQMYQSKDYNIPQYFAPTLEIAEIHSMSMEFITWPWMELYFGKDTDKYKYQHLTASLSFIPYGVAVDEFQHEVYEKPFMTKEERKKTWRDIEKKYLPYKDYDDSDLLNRGGYFFRQGHIFREPFYYIDYALAQVCAFEFWQKFNIDKTSAWQDYLKLCRAGGSLAFNDVLKHAGITNPFNKEAIPNVIGYIDEWLKHANHDF